MQLKQLNPLKSAIFAYTVVLCLIGTFLLSNFYLDLLHWNQVLKWRLFSNFTSPSPNNQSLRNNSNSANNKAKACLKPHQHVIFIKTHKCASSTIQNIFFRYGENHNLTFAFPKKWINYYAHPPEKFSRDSFKVSGIQNSSDINFMCFHARPNYTEMLEVMPKSTPLSNPNLLVTIIRDPVQMFQSMYKYGQTAVGGWMNGLTLEQFLEKIANEKVVGSDVHSNSLLIEMTNTDEKHNETEKLMNYAQWNPMLYDLGVDFQQMLAPKTEIMNTISELDNLFDLVMISNFMDESLVLLKELLCWKWEDMVVFIKNKRNTKIQDVDPLSNQTHVNNLLKWNYADKLLYDYFVNRLQQRIVLYGQERMKRDVQTLKILTEKVKERCLVDDQHPASASGDKKPKHFKEYLPKYIISYQIRDRTDRTCFQLAIPELEYIRRLWKIAQGANVTVV